MGTSNLYDYQHIITTISVTVQQFTFTTTVTCQFSPRPRGTSRSNITVSLSLDSGPESLASTKLAANRNFSRFDFYFFVVEVMSNYLTTDGLKNFLYFRRPVAFATLLINHCYQYQRKCNSLHRSSSDHSVDAGRSPSFGSGRYRLISAARAQAAA